ncbi:MAG: hypothetical protein ACJ8DI_25935 [Ktedonobacteraceae bacterium]
MEWQTNWEGPLQSYLQRFDGLLRDARTRQTFQESIKGIMAAGTLICQRIAACSPLLSKAKDGAQRILRLATGESRKRSQVDAEHLTAQLREVALEQLAQAPEDELWLIADGSDLRKPYAEAMPALMQVRDLEGKLVPGYRTLNVLGVTPGRRGILYHRLFSSEEAGFVSEPAEVQQALATVSQAVAALRQRMHITWILDSGFDDSAVWRTIWENQDHVVCRVYHSDRLVEFQDRAGQWQHGNIAQACTQLRPIARAETSLEVQRGKQACPKKQPVVVDLSACPLRLSYWSNVRRPGGKGQLVTKRVWLVQVVVRGTNWEPWLLLTDWPVENEQQAVRIFAMYRQRWAVEDSFKVTKECLGWEEVQVLDLRGIRTLVAMAWVAAGFLYQLGVTLEWAEVQLLAKLGGWVPHKDRRPGKITLMRGLRRLLDMLATQAILTEAATQQGGLPPNILTFLQGWKPPQLDL